MEGTSLGESIFTLCGGDWVKVRDIVIGDFLRDADLEDYLQTKAVKREVGGFQVLQFHSMMVLQIVAAGRGCEAGHGDRAGRCSGGRHGALDLPGNAADSE